MAEKFSVGVIGLGGRGMGHLDGILTERDDVTVSAVCDVYEDRIRAAQEKCKSKKGWDVYGTTDYRDLIENGGADVIFVFSAWENHVPAALYAMRHRKQVAIEVGGAYSLDDCFELVRAHEETGIHCMMLENCCYDRYEMMVMRMVREGVFGTLVHCEGGYRHDLRHEITYGRENRHYRLRNYKSRCSENYPTHELGPIARLIGINRGNRMVSLVSVSSKARGFADYVERHLDTINPHRVGEVIKQGDIVTTLITCENGETITLRLDTSLPRFYNREFTVRGTRGMYEMGNNMVYFDGMEEWFDTLRNYTTYQNNAVEYEEKYLPEAWRRMTEEGLKSGHGGMDGVEFRAFFEALRAGGEMPIDVYDMAAWMSITYLSEQSVLRGGAPQQIPDFTRGKYKTRPLRDVL